MVRELDRRLRADVRSEAAPEAPQRPPTQALDGTVGTTRHSAPTWSLATPPPPTDGLTPALLSLWAERAFTRGSLDVRQNLAETPRSDVRATTIV